MRARKLLPLRLVCVRVADLAANASISARGVPTSFTKGVTVSDEQQRYRMGCRRYRKANPALSVTMLACAMATWLWATWLFCQLQQPCALAEVLCNTLCLHRCRVALVKRLEMVPAVPKQTSRDRCVRQSTRGNGSYRLKINDDGRPA